MLIALDYDGTYTADTALWDRFIRLAKSMDHEVMIVTMRHEDEPVRVSAEVDRIIYTARRAKVPHMESLGLNVSIWIDDRPDFCVRDAAPRSLAENARTGLWG